MESLAFSCRLCLKDPALDALVFSVFDTYQGRVLVELIDELFAIKIVEHDRLLSVCLDCVNRINTVHKIHQLFIENNRKLQELLTNEPTPKSPQNHVVYEECKIDAPASIAAQNETEATVDCEDDQLIETNPEQAEDSTEENVSSIPSELIKKSKNVVIVSIEEANEDDFDLLFESDTENCSLKDGNGDQCVREESPFVSTTIQLPQNKCYLCGVIFNSALEFLHHLPDHFTQMPYTCLECNGLVFKTVREASKHVGMHDIDERPFKCRICTLRFPTRPNSLAHERKMHRFKLKRQAAIAQRSHSALEFRQSAKQEHDKKKRTFDQAALHRCEICSKLFTAKKNLTRHMMVHTGEKPFKCVQCNRSFRQAGELKNHQRVHKNEKPYTCDQCDKVYRNSLALWKHKKKVHLSKTNRRRTIPSAEANEK